jgi:hypothetical protein
MSKEIGEHLAGVNTSVPGIVVSYDAGSGRASVQPAVRRGYRDASGTRRVERLPVVNGVPVAFPGCRSGWVKFPIAPGDEVLLVVASAALDRWAQGSGGEVDPGDDRRHALGDCVAVPAVFHAHDGASPIIEFTSGGEIRAGGSAQLATKADIDAIRTWLVSHVHVVPGAVGGGAGLTTSTAALTPPVISGTAVLKGS